MREEVEPQEVDKKDSKVEEKNVSPPEPPPTTQRQTSIPKMHPDSTYDFKFILAGDSWVGKSSLLSRFRSQKFQKDIPSTIGFDCCELSVQTGEKRVNLEILDTAGEERFMSVATSFYRDRAGAFLVYDVTKRETFDHLDRWLKELRVHNDKIVVMLIGNKFDLAEKGAARAVAFSEGSDYALQNKLTGGFIETSAKNDAKNGDLASIPRALAQRIYDGILDKSIDPNISQKGIRVSQQQQQTIKLQEQQQKNKKCC